MDRVNAGFNVIMNDPLYLTIAALLALIFIFSIIKRYAKWIIGVVAVIFVYICYIMYQGEPIPMTIDELKDKAVKDGELMLNKAKKTISKK